MNDTFAVGQRIEFEVVTRGGRAAAVELRIRLDSVECWYREHCSGVLDREGFRNWLTYPAGALVVDELTWLQMSAGDIAIVLDDVGAWSLAPSTLAQLWRWV